MWKTVKLGDSCKMYQPKTISAKDMIQDGKYLVFGANGVIGRYDKYNHEAPQLLVTCRGATCGAVNVSEPFSWINGNAMVIRPDLEEISLKYMEYLFRGGINLSRAITGAAQPQITRKSLEPIEFSYPPLPEQKRIVAKLDAAFAEIDRAIDVAESKYIAVEKLKAALLASTLGGEGLKTVKLGDVIEKTETVNPASKFPNESFDYIDVSSVSKERLAIEETKTLLGKDAPSRARRRVHKDDVIFATVRPTLKRVAVVPRELDGQICSTGYIVLRGRKDFLLPRYLFHWMTSRFVMDYVESVQTGASYPAVTDKQVKEITILLPPLPEQQRIVAKLDAAFAEIDKSAESISEAKANYLALKSAILAQELQPPESKAA